MGHDMKRAENGTRAGRQEVQHTWDSEDALAYMMKQWKLRNRSEAVRMAVTDVAARMGWRPKP